MKKANCTNCGCRFRFHEDKIITDVDIFGKKTTYTICPVCEKHIEPDDWSEIKIK